MAASEEATETAVAAVAALLFRRKFGVPWGVIADPTTRRAWRADACRLLEVDVAQFATEPRAPHPETVCRRCGGANVPWSAPSPLWNAVMRGGSIDGPWEFGELICPTCFCVLAEERGVATRFVVDAETVHVELETVTPSGRTWDPERGLWVDAAGQDGAPS